MAPATTRPLLIQRQNPASATSQPPEIPKPASGGDAPGVDLVGIGVVERVGSGEPNGGVTYRHPTVPFAPAEAGVDFGMTIRIEQRDLPNPLQVTSRYFMPQRRFQAASYFEKSEVVAFENKYAFVSPGLSFKGADDVIPGEFIFETWSGDLLLAQRRIEVVSVGRYEFACVGSLGAVARSRLSGTPFKFGDFKRADNLSSNRCKMDVYHESGVRFTIEMWMQADKVLCRLWVQNNKIPIAWLWVADVGKSGRGFVDQPQQFGATMQKFLRWAAVARKNKVRDFERDLPGYHSVSRDRGLETKMQLRFFVDANGVPKFGERKPLFDELDGTFAQLAGSERIKEITAIYSAKVHGLTGSSVDPAVDRLFR